MKTRMLKALSGASFELAIGKLAIGMIMVTALAGSAQASHRSSTQAKSSKTKTSKASETPADNAVVSTAKIYDSVQLKNVLFTIRRVDSMDGTDKKSVETFFDPNGKVAVKTETIVGPDEKLKSYVVDQDQTHEHGKIEVKGGKVYFTFIESSGKVKKDSEDLDGNVIVGATIRDFVKQHWQDLMKGNDVDMRFGVPERQETVGFKLFKDKEVDQNGTKVEVIKMKPTSFVIAAIVSPLYFFFDRADQSLIQINGRTLPKVKVGDSWKDLDAVSVFGK